jgi:4-amino-4-deoxy-L-arabinose transferase-like glycosyltransferase
MVNLEKMGPAKFEKSARWIVLILVISFILAAANNISWGAPGTWHPDELAIRVIKALEGEWVFDLDHFDYPSLPKYVMYGIGLLIHQYGVPADYLIGMRFISVLLGGCMVALSYRLARKAGAEPSYALLAAGLTLTSSELLLNASFAHNDIYLAFFTALAALALLRYSTSAGRAWLYLSCLLVGMAASSKYNGASLLIVPFVLLLTNLVKSRSRDWLRIIETFALSLFSFASGYAIGTPRAVMWSEFYYRNVLPALSRHLVYGWQPDARIGLFSQWKEMVAALGLPSFLLGLIAIAFFLIQYILKKPWTRNISTPETGSQPEEVLLLILLAFDLPILFPYNVQPRYFTALIAPLAALSALFFQRAAHFLKSKDFNWGKQVILIGCIGLLAYNGLRSAAVSLSFANDQRIPASDYVSQLPAEVKIEYTLYPPNIDKSHFFSAYNYPIQFLKLPGQELPTSPYFVFNSGEPGIEARRPDYLVIDSFTYARFSDDYICQLHMADCVFFERLFAGETSYQLVRTFEYDLPSFIPDVNLAFLNPDIRIYQRITP